MERIKKRFQFLAAKKDGVSWVCPYFILTANRSLNGPARDSVDRVSPALWRVGFTVSKRVGGAVERNRVKRRLRALTAKCFVSEVMQTGCDYVITARREALKAPWEDAVWHMNKALLGVSKKLKAQNCQLGGLPRRSQKPSQISLGAHMTAKDNTCEVGNVNGLERKLRRATLG